MYTLALTVITFSSYRWWPVPYFAYLHPSIRFASMAFAKSCASSGAILFREASCVNPSSCAAGLLSSLFRLTILISCLVLSRQCLQYCVRLRGFQKFPRFVQIIVGFYHLYPYAHMRTSTGLIFNFLSRRLISACVARAVPFGCSRVKLHLGYRSR